MRLILASASPRRAELLTAAGFSFDVLAVDIDERRHPNEMPEHYVRRLAAEKSEAAAARLASDKELVVLGADTAVVVDGDVLGKPESDEDARAMLARLSGRRHQVLTGISLRLTSAGSEELGCVESTDVFFDHLGDEDIDWYVQTGEGRDKAGAYAIQGLCSRFVPRIDGSYSNVVGLPVAAVHRLLTRLQPLDSPA